MSEELQSVLLGTTGLWVVALVAAWLARDLRAAEERTLGAVRRVAGVAVVCQCVHFAEELAGGFPQRFPEVFGLAPWSGRLWVGFNLVWIVAWTLAAIGGVLRPQLALFVLWFLAIASIANGVAHPLLALASGGYFPGLLSAPLVGVAGALLARRLAPA